ncbi:hypothetical protein SDRG_03523 [Saprolegnia diclina VS20]|uniref:Uncharacterized protein n=1 Tax=Saprolegnia diclina (strain VS20) TaxID=1156394 RepID=T0S2S3_SAPDV|nr:hypothetical protein SDRG_03523 [Saprolegnia diclina VS20]EQC39318.1 hypothetical protein SDRG_03523 [Saprolegnia diclina VS20]|eukprot:XP_008607379.1 hypothetical protein SDRG_03523 [Saprolegnia diclina VS20]
MLMKREHPADTLHAGPSKRAKPEPASALMWSSIPPLAKLTLAFSTVLSHQAKALDVLQATREWDVARNLLLKTEVTRKYIAKERQRYIVAMNALRGALEPPAPKRARKSVRFSPVVTVCVAPDVDRSSPVTEPPSMDELLVIKAVGLRGIPRQNFSELW